MVLVGLDIVHKPLQQYLRWYIPVEPLYFELCFVLITSSKNSLPQS